MNTRFHRHIALSLLALGLAGCGGYSFGPISGDAFTTYYDPEKGRQVRLILVHEYVALAIDEVSVSEGLSEEGAAALEAIAAMEPDLVSIVPSDLVTFTVSPTAFLGVPAHGLSDEDLLALIARLNAIPEITTAEPIVRRDFFPDPLWCQYCDGYDTVQPYFTALFSASTPEAEIDALIDSYGLEAEIQNVFQGAVTYRLRTTADTGYSTLEMATIFHEHPLTIRAYPEFAGGPVTSVS